MMRNFRSIAPCLAMVLGFSTSTLVPQVASAQSDPKVNIRVDATPEMVTLSRPAGKDAKLPLETYAAYLVTIENKTTNTLNRVFLRGTATNTGASDTIFYDSYVSTKAEDKCEVGTEPNQVTCTLQSLQPGVATQFIVVYKAPMKGSQINFSWTAGGFEGNGVGNGCCAKSDVARTPLVDPSTDPSFQTQARTFVKPDTGGTVFTGSEAITTSTDGWTTIVLVPSYLSQTFTTAQISEFSNTDISPPVTLACPSYSTNSTCFASTLSIPGTFKSLQITIRLDRNFFSLGRTDPATLSLQYTGDGPAPEYVGSYPYTLKLCSQDKIDVVFYGYSPDDVPLPGRPCMSKAPFVYPNGFSIKDLRGDLEFGVSARDNGRYAQ